MKPNLLLHRMTIDKNGVRTTQLERSPNGYLPNLKLRMASWVDAAVILKNAMGETV